MADNTLETMRDRVDGLYRAESRRVFATLIRLLGDFDLAEEALHDAFAAAVEHWSRDGVPRNPPRLVGVRRPLQGDQCRASPPPAIRRLAAGACRAAKRGQQRP